MKTEYWHCTIGPAERSKLGFGPDFPMAKAVKEAFEKLTGAPADSCSGGWGLSLEDADHVDFAALSEEFKRYVISSYDSEKKPMPRHVRAWTLLLREEKRKALTPSTRNRRVQA